jgi:hypothetical protein
MDRRGFLGFIGSVGALGLTGLPVLTKLTPERMSKVKHVDRIDEADYLREIAFAIDNPEMLKNWEFVLTYKGESFSGPKVKDANLVEKPFLISLRGEDYHTPKPFTYDGVRVCTTRGVLLPTTRFVVNPSLKPGDILRVCWSVTI